MIQETLEHQPVVIMENIIFAKLDTKLKAIGTSPASQIYPIYKILAKQFKYNLNNIQDWRCVRKILKQSVKNN